MNRKTVLITGASSGIGKATAIKFASKGYRIVITCKKSEDLLFKTKLEVEEWGVPCLSFIGDMGNFQMVSRLFHELEEFSGGIDILVNNAGISYIGLLTDLTVEEWNALLNTNLSSVFYCCKLAIPYMISKKEGKIINISSIWGIVGSSCEVAYSATKGGMNALTKSLAKELAPSNIQVNAIACGLIDTKMNASFTVDEMKDILDDIPAGRAGTPNEVAELIYYLSEGSSYLNGQVISLDGGWK